jgi:hypothetical protein
MFPVTLPWLKAVFRANAAINPRFLVWVCFNRCCGYNIADALSNELAHRISVFVSVDVGRSVEHIPIHVIEAVLKRGIRLVRVSLH